MVLDNSNLVPHDYAAFLCCSPKRVSSNEIEMVELACGSGGDRMKAMHDLFLELEVKIDDLAADEIWRLFVDP